MADLRAEQILAAVLSTVTGLTTTGSRTARGRVYPHESSQLPALGVFMGADQPVAEHQTGLIDWDLQVLIEAVEQVETTETENTIETRLAQIRKEVHAALFADYTLGLSFVLDLMPGTAGQPVLDGEGNLPTGSQVLEFIVRYRSSRGDVSA